MRIILITLVSAIFVFCSNGSKQTKETEENAGGATPHKTFAGKTDTATLAGGCFWCVEASFDQIEGVKEAVSGYAGGKSSTATYKQVSRGNTGHAEAVQIYYDKEIIDYRTLLDIFFAAHDPTQLNRQGPDVGSQYRSEIFYHDKAQLKLVKETIKKIDRSGRFEEPVVTEISPYQNFYKAEEYHQNYIQKYPDDHYVHYVSRPKIKKVRKEFKDLLKEGFDYDWE